MNILSVIKDIFKPAVDLVDDLHTSDEERLQYKAQTLDTYVNAIEKGLEYEQENLKTRARLIEAEAKSEHFITATWRPTVMLFLTGCVGAHWFGFTPDNLSEEAVNGLFTLVQIGIGGYVVGRSVEKVVPGVVSSLKKKEEV